MRGISAMNFPAFKAAAGQLRHAGFEVISPAEQDEAEGAAPIRNLADYVRRLPGFLERDIALIDTCDGVGTLDNWEKSTGARIEVAHARSRGMPVQDYLDWVTGGVPRAPTIFEEAEKLVYGPREHAYGHPKEDFTRTAMIWTAILGKSITAQQVALCMVGVKMSRECHAHKADNLIDGCGYFGTLARLHEKE
jgi:hypothetical protein